MRKAWLLRVTPSSARLERIDQALDAERQRQELQQHEVHRDHEVLSAAFGRFVHLWLTAHAATLRQPISQATTDAGAELYKRFATKLADDFLRGYRFVHDLPKVADAKPSNAR